MHHIKRLFLLTLLVISSTLCQNTLYGSTTSSTPSDTAPPADPTATPTESPQFPRASSPYQAKDPLSINYVIDKVEDNLEKNSDKQYKVNWDFEIIYHDGKVLVCIDYLKDDLKHFNKITTEQLNTFLLKIIKELNKNLHIKNIEIHGMINQDDTKTPSYTFTYKDGNLDIK